MALTNSGTAGHHSEIDRALRYPAQRSRCRAQTVARGLPGLSTNGPKQQSPPVRKVADYRQHGSAAPRVARKRLWRLLASARP